MCLEPDLAVPIERWHICRLPPLQAHCCTLSKGRKQGTTPHLPAITLAPELLPGPSPEGENPEALMHMATIASLLTISSPSFTLFSKFFSSFPRGTCSLSVSRHHLFSFGCHLPPYRGNKASVLELHSQTTRLFECVWPSRDTYHLVRRLCRSGLSCVPLFDPSEESQQIDTLPKGLSPSLVLCSNRLAPWRSLYGFIWAIAFHTSPDYNSAWLLNL